MRERTSAMRARSISAKPTPALLAHVEQHLAPRIDHQRMAEGVAAILVMADLGRGDDEQPGLDRPRPQQHVPMRLAGRHGERRGDRDHVGVGLGEPREQHREAQVVADGEAELADRRAVDHHRPVAGAIDGGFAPALAGRQIDVEQMDLVVARADLARRGR